jgi:hypothetical protein
MLGFFGGYPYGLAASSGGHSSQPERQDFSVYFLSLTGCLKQVKECITGIKDVCFLLAICNSYTFNLFSME